MSINLFDIKTLFLAKHAQHVVLIHFPIALFVIGVAFDFLAQKTQRPQWAAAAYCNLAGAALTAIPTLITGVIAWQWALEGQRLKGVLLIHLLMGCFSSVLIWSAWFIHMRTQKKPGKLLPGYRLPIEAGAVAIIAFTGYLGGILSGVNVPS
jgi:uncharacterized membrane protein